MDETKTLPSDKPTAKGRYSQLEPLREPFLNRARDAALVTLPHLFPPQGFTSTSKLYTPYQSLGSRGVNNLAAKLLLTMFPSNSPFYRYDLTESALREMEARGLSATKRGQIDVAMSKYERTIQRKIEAGAYRPRMSPALKQLIVGGNTMLYMPRGKPIKVFNLADYVCKRDSSGNVIEHITVERVSPTALPEDIQQMIPHHAGNAVEDDVEIYTWVRRERNRWVSRQEIEDIVVPGSEGTYPIDKSPYIVLRWHVIDGEDYGRGHVEDYLGDLYSLEGLNQSIVEGSAAAARVLILVKPGSPTTMRQISKAPSGSVLSGNKDDVGVLQLEKYADFQVAQKTVEDISKRLSFAFLLNTAVQRSGDRVTAEEIRYIAQELESALGGTYSVLSQELQLAFLVRVEYMMQRAGELPKLPREFAEPTIITGLEALGRGQDLAKYRGLIQMLNETGPNLATKLLARLDEGELMDRLLAASTIDGEGLVKTAEQMAAEQQQQQMTMAMQSLGPQAVNAMGGLMKQQIANQAGSSAPPEAPQASAK